MKIFNVNGYFKGTLPEFEEGEVEILVSDFDSALPDFEEGEEAHVSGYWDNDIYFYGISEEELNQIISCGGAIEEFYPTSYTVDYDSEK